MSPLERKYTEIKKYFYLLPPDKVDEAIDYLDFLLMKYVPKEKRVKSLEGIWSDIGTDKIKDLEKELKSARKEMEDEIIGKLEKWNI